MFKTDPCCRISGFDASAVPHWDRVELVAQAPLLLVSIPTGEANDAEAALTLSFLVEADGFERLLAECGQASRVDLLSPAWLNGDASWKLEPLLELHLCADLEAEVDRAWLFVVGTGRYAYSPVRSPAENLISVKRVFKSRESAQSDDKEVIDD